MIDPDFERQEEVLARLACLPALLERIFAGTTPEGAREPGPRGGFAPVEHAWHLADLEREAHALRIRRVLDEEDPELASFDGARIARERDYRARSLEEGLRAFRVAREANLARLAGLDEAQWRRAGTMEASGRRSLRELVLAMAEHDASHLREIEEGVAAARERASIEEAVRAFRAAFEAGDLEGLFSLYAEDLVKLRDGEPPEARADVRARVSAAFRENDTRLSVENERIEVVGNAAYARGTFRVTLLPRSGAPPVELTRRFLEVWRKEEAGWRVACTMDQRLPEGD